MWWKKKKPEIKTVEVTAIGGGICPKCNEDGGLFHYDGYYNWSGGGVGDGNPFYQCENCMAVMFDEEYNRLIKMEERKAKLKQINESIS